ncbi:MAG: hypothetical protein Q8M07_15190 [Prosthecobacter sp.]|nr:hypothetical protein [Prosthecobacter sp.]
MKLISFILLALLYSSSLWGADPELLRLQKAYEDATRRALAPLQTTYQKELQKLQEQYAKSGKLDAALEVKAELEKMGLQQSQAANTAIANDESAIKKKITKGKFVFYFAPPRSKLISFGRNGEIEEGAAEQERKWKIEGNELLIYNQTGQLSHALEYVPATDSFKTSARPSLWMSKQAYMENAKE